MEGGWVNDNQVRREVHSRRQEREELLGDLVGLDVVYIGEGRPGGLYPEHVGCRCRVVDVNVHAAGCPLVIEFTNGFRGIAEPSWLTEVEADA